MEDPETSGEYRPRDSVLMDRSGTESLSSHALPVPTEQTFGMNDHPSQHYHAVEALSSNVLPSTRDRIAPPEPQAKPPSTKRRKINTCFPCKQRKVKCDRQQPYCGQCQKHRIPAERCVWSSDMTLPPDMQSAAAASAALTYTKPDASHAPMSLGAGDWAASSQGTDLALDNDTRAVIERISHLEQRLTTNTASQPTSHDLPTSSAGQTQIDPILLAGTGLSLGDVNADRSTATSLPQDAAVAAELAFWRSKMEQQHQRPPHSSDAAQMTQMQAEQNIAADALAMFARHSQQSSLPGSEQAIARPSAVSSGADTLPRHNLVHAFLDNTTFSVNSATSRVRAALDLLPDTQQTDYLLKILQTVDLHVSYGISWRLVRTQLANLRTQLASWNRMHASVPPEQLDLSFLALLLTLLGTAAQYTEARFFIEQGFCTTPEQIEPFVDSWIDCAQSLLATDDFVSKTNWNHLATLLLFVDHHAVRGRLQVSLVAMATLIRLCEQQGYHVLGSATDDERLWCQSPASRQVRVSPVSSSARPGVWLRPSAASISLPDRSHLVREAARRLWIKIACKDMLLGTVIHRTTQVDPTFATTAPPLNVDEDDLPDGETHVLSSIQEAGRATMNNLTPYIYQIADLGRQWGLLLYSRQLTYAHVLEFDAKFRGLLSSLPVYLRPDPTLEQLPEVRQEQARHPYLAMHRLIVFEAVNQRLLVLHRDFLCRGHQDEKHAYSTRVAVDAARTILSCRQQIDNVHPAVQKHAAFRHHLFQAAIVLMLHLLAFHNKAQGSSQVAHQLRDDISLIINYLHSTGDPSTSVPIAQKVALKLIDLLFAEAHARADRIDSGISSDDKAVTESTASSTTLSTIAMDGANSSQLFPALGTAPPSTPDHVSETAASFSAQLLHPDFGNRDDISEIFASLDELMVPIY